MKPFAFFVAVLITALPPAGARNIYVPTYDELFAKSDFVVIAQPARKTRDTNERATVTGVAAMMETTPSSEWPALANCPELQTGAALELLSDEIRHRLDRSPREASRVHS